MTKKILITSALPYVNNVPHLGNLMCILSADVFNRFQKLKGVKSVFICGTDEHGTTTESIAKKLNLSPMDASTKFHKLHKEIYDWFCIDFDNFGRTSAKENWDVTQEVFLDLYNNGFISEVEEEQLFDEKENKFLADRFVEGTCPHCGYASARGDQCDSCTKLLDPKDLINPKSTLSNTTPVIKKTKNLYILLDKLQPLVKEYVDSVSQHWTDNAKKTTLAWFKEGLKPRAITRDLDFGIKVPLNGFEDKVFYVWFDAVLGYISITKNLTSNFKDYWMSPSDTRLVQFIGKDNIPFHTLFFPAYLLGTKKDYTLMESISVNEYINYENAKFSKSRGVGVFGNDAISTGIPADVWRYYLIINRPESSDTNFLWDDFKEKNNSELVANLGNLVNRTLVFIKKFCDGKIVEGDNSLHYSAQSENILNLFDKIELKSALKEIMQLSRLGNQYFQDNTPWVLVKDNPDKANIVLANLVNLIKDIAILLYPILPNTSKSIFEQINCSQHFSVDSLKIKLSNHSISDNPKPLFSILEDSLIQEFKDKFSGKSNEPSNSDILASLDLRVAKIIEVSKHPDADKLFVEKLDVGDLGERIICSGLAEHYSPEDLLGKNIILFSNLPPKMFRGVKSEGMLFASEENGVIGVLTCPDSKPGDRLSFEGLESINNVDVDFKKFLSIDLFVDKTGLFALDNKFKCKTKVVVDKNVSGRVR